MATLEQYFLKELPELAEKNLLEIRDQNFDNDGWNFNAGVLPTVRQCWWELCCKIATPDFDPIKIEEEVQDAIIDRVVKDLQAKGF